ncbi:MAG: carbohydrate-binding protein [Methanomicrobiales archaeon]|nr:carbohydrate-binding protein [Methanomicrobiales archaeon]
MKKTQFLVLTLSVMLAMAAPALAAQDQTSRGSYDVAVYIDDTKVLAEGSDGQIISDGTAGIDDSKVIQAAMKAVSNGSVVIQAGTYALNSPVEVRVSNPTPAPSEKPDLVVTDISWKPKKPTAGSPVTLRATIKNQGDAPTPAGVKHAVLFTFDDGGAGSSVWSDTHTASIAPGSWVTVTASGGSAGATWTAVEGTHTVKATVDDASRIAESDETNNVRSEQITVLKAASTPTPTQTPTPTPTEEPSDVPKPYKAHAVPGRINFVDFDFGGEGVAYHDTEAGNQGGYAYRTDSADVDIGERSGVDVPVVSHTYAGEWIRFSEVQVAESGTYVVTFYTSTTEDGKSFSVLVDGKKVATVEAPNTGDWYTFAPTTVQLPLTAGKHTIQITMDTGWVDMAHVKFATETPTPTPTATPTATPTVTPTPTATATPKPTQTPVPTPGDKYGAGANPTGNPIGGGDGYTDIISRNDPRVKFIVDTRSELLSALQSARSGDVIYVEGNANIDMTGSSDVRVPAGVTIASNRGENGASGGRIYQSSASGADWSSLFLVNGENARFTGLRIQGPDPSTNSPARVAIKSWSKRLEVDNCEIWGWGAAAVNVYSTADPDMKTGGYVHHNYIHHCQNSGLGYGVVVSSNAVCLVEANYFDYHRHAIAGGADAGNGYEARYNICGPNFTAGYAHNFDMHTGPNNAAGDKILIHHNTFMATGPKDAFPVFIQGVPRTGAYIDHNWFYYTQLAPVWQSNGNGNLYVTDNVIGPNKTLAKSGPILYL